MMVSKKITFFNKQYVFLVLTIKRHCFKKMNIAQSPFLLCNKKEDWNFFMIFYLFYIFQIVIIQRRCFGLISF